MVKVPNGSKKKKSNAFKLKNKKMDKGYVKFDGDLCGCVS